MKTIKKYLSKTLTVFALSVLTLLTTNVAFGDTLVAPSVLAVRDVTPEFPSSAMRRSISGSVTVKYDVDGNGKAKNVEIVNAQPDRTFNSTVIKAVRRSEFKLLNGLTSASNIERTYQFTQEMEKNSTLSMN